MTDLTDYIRRVSGPTEKALRERIAKMERNHERELGEMIDQRDQAEQWADRLAYAIAPIDVIGEHSSGNNPWANALEHIAQGAHK